MSLDVSTGDSAGGGRPINGGLNPVKSVVKYRQTQAGLGTQRSQSNPATDSVRVSCTECRF